MQQTLIPLLLGLLLSAGFASVPAVAAETNGKPSPQRTLDLSLSREDLNAAWTAMPSPSVQPEGNLPGLGSGPNRMGEPRRADLPYGSGYEARQQGGSTPGSARMGPGNPGGRGAGRGR